MKSLFFFVVNLLCLSVSLAQKPVNYWTFDEKDLYVDQSGTKRFNVETYKAKTRKTEGAVRSAIKTDSPSDLIVSNLFNRSDISTDISLEFMYNGREFLFTTFPAPDFRLTYNLSGISLRCMVNRNGRSVQEDWSIPLKGTGITSYNQLENGNWHHFVLICKRSGELRIWIDGKTDSLFMKRIPAYDHIEIKGSDGFRLDISIDELAFCNSALSPALIRQHFHQAKSNNHYTFQLISALSDDWSSETKEVKGLDIKEFAPGYPDYNVQATDQLKNFPLPRYSATMNLPRNFPWMDITYLHRELPGNGGKGFGKVNPSKAVELVKELSDNWNYYMKLPCLRLDSTTAQRRYTNSSDIFSSLIRYANEHPDIPAATILMEVQGNPAHAGFDRSGPFVLAQNLSDYYYLCDKSGKPISYGNKKWLSPFTSLELVKKDGLTSAFYLKQLAKYLKRDINMINENGEWFGHKWPEALLAQAPSVTSFIQRNKMNYDRFNGWMQNKFDSTYKAAVLNSLHWKDVKFTFYNVSAYNENYWPDYSERIYTNSLFGGTPRSTPSFYPSHPDNWRLASGPLNGYGTIAEGRKVELGLGVKRFSPFVCAGWMLEENNIRPAQWLGLLKSMIMLGADFFHVGYFNVTGSTGWPNGIGPNDPRGYIYQAAMPSYAQALASRLDTFLERSELLTDTFSKAARMPFAFNASSLSHLVLVRKLGDKYLIYGSVQPSSNIKGNADVESLTSIILNGKKVTFKIRRQGSMYMMDLSGPQVVFYQLDGWHQYEHPYYWSKEILIEAENADDLIGCALTTEKTGREQYDFSSFNSFVKIVPDSSFVIINIPSKRGQELSLTFVAKKEKGNKIPSLLFETSFGKIEKRITSTESINLKLSERECRVLSMQSGDKLRISSKQGIVFLDQIVF